MLDDAYFVNELETNGCVLLDNILSDEVVQRCRIGVERAIEAEALYHGTCAYPDYGTVQCCALYDRVFIDVLDQRPLIDPFDLVLGEGCIIYAYLSSSLPPHATNAANRIHVDCPRLIPGYPTNMGAVFPLDDFTEINGATWYLPGSHTRADKPREEEFFSEARRLVAPAGSAWYFNPRLWHSAGTNETNSWRHSFTLNMCRPFMKQRFDLPRLLAGIDLDGISDNARQKLGFFAQPPTSLDEYYAPLAKRTFRQPYE